VTCPSGTCPGRGLAEGSPMRPVLIVVLLPLMLLAASLSGARELARHEGIRLNVKDLINFNHTEHSGFTVLIPE